MNIEYFGLDIRFGLEVSLNPLSKVERSYLLLVRLGVIDDITEGTLTTLLLYFIKYTHGPFLTTSFTINNSKYLSFRTRSLTRINDPYLFNYYKETTGVL